MSKERKINAKIRDMIIMVFKSQKALWISAPGRIFFSSPGVAEWLGDDLINRVMQVRILSPGLQ